MDNSRRRFVGVLCALGGAWAAAVSAFPILKYLSFSSGGELFGKDGRAPVSKISLSDVAQPGMGKNGSYSGRGLVIFRNSAGVLKAFDAKCTHAGCNVAFEGTRIFCNCHGGVYDLNGKNIAGPPPRPLTELQVIVDQGALYVAPMKS